MKYIILLSNENFECSYRLFNSERLAIAFAKAWDKPGDRIQVYKIDTTTPIYTK